MSPVFSKHTSLFAKKLFDGVTVLVASIVAPHSMDAIQILSD